MKQGWEYKKLGEVCDIINGKNQRAVENPKGIYPIMGSGGIIGYADDYLCNEGTTIIGRKGSINKPIYVNQKFWNVDTAFGLQPKEGTESRFLFYLCKSINFERYNKSVTIPSLVKSDLLKIDIHIPYFSVQKQIASELDLLSGVIEKQKAQLEELDKLAQSIFHDMFGDPVTNEKGWEVKKLAENVYEMFLGPFGSSLKVDSYVPEKEAYCMVYEQKHAIQATLHLENHFINKEKYESLKRFEVKPGDFIMSCRGTIGKLFYLPDNAPSGIIHPSLMKIRIKETSYLPKYFSFMLPKIIANETTNGNCVQMAITAKALGNKNIIIPPLSLQQEFEAKVEAIEAMKAKVRQSLKEAETLFNSRMDYYFN